MAEPGGGPSSRRRPHGPCVTLRTPRCVRTRAPPDRPWPPVATRPALTNHGSPDPAVFDTLSERLRATLGNLTGRGRISEADVDTAMREVRLALLEADVNFKVVKDFVARVREKAIGGEVLGSLTAGQQVVKIVHDELVDLLSAGDRVFHLSRQPGGRGDGRPAGLGQDHEHGQACPLRRQAGPPAAARGRRPVPPGRRGPARDARQATRHPGLPAPRPARASRISPARASRRPSARSAMS